MIITFPNLGSVSVLLSVLLREWQIPFVAPPKTTETTIMLGSKYSPPDACLPMKIVLGNFIEGYRRGADTAIFPGGNGPCLFGCFSEMTQLALEENGIPLRVLRMDATKNGISEIYRIIKKSSDKNTLNILSPLGLGAKCCYMLDKLENKLLFVRASITDESIRHNFDRFEKGVYALLGNAQSFFELDALISAAMDKADSFMGCRQNILTVGIVGDIYTTIDGDANHRLQRHLADMGVYSERSMTISKWFRDKLPIQLFGWRWYSKPYIDKSIGGFARETVGYAAMWSRSVDGIIQVHPLNCMPEIVAKSVLCGISEKLSVPLLSLVLDELTGDAGYLTRIEAFIDLLEAKKENEKMLARG